MKTIGIIFFNAILSFRLFAQPIPNAGFENWMNGAPNSWYFVPNIPGASTVTQSSVAHSGSSALRMDVVTFSSMTLTSSVISGTGSTTKGFPYALRPASLTGYYQFSPAAQSGDTLTITVSFFKTDANESAFGGGAIGIGTSASSYVPFTVPLVFLQADNPAVCVITFLVRGPMSGGQTTPHVGSYALIDDIEFAGSTGVAQDESMQPLRSSLLQNYPNPFNPSTAINYQLSQNSQVKLVVVDMLGREIATLVNEIKNSGDHQVVFDARTLSSGMYFYKLTAGSFTQIRKMTLIK
jgi:hypothetical protein